MRFLTGDTHPDHDSICKFRRENKDLLSHAFHQVLELAARARILQVGLTIPEEIQRREATQAMEQRAARQAKEQNHPAKRREQRHSMSHQRAADRPYIEVDFGCALRPTGC